jgi:hypothetical protein
MPPASREVPVIAYLIDVPEDLVAVLIEDGWIADCQSHGLEVAAIHSPEAFEQHVDEMVYGRKEDHA